MNSSVMRGRDIGLAILLAAIAAGSIGGLVYNVFPLYMGPLQDSTGLSNSQIGFIAGAFFLGTNLTGISAFFWVRSASLMYIALVTTLSLILFLLLAARIDSFILQLVITSLIGAASGALYAISTTLIGGTRNTPRWFGIKFTVECLAGAILLFVLPVTLIPGLGFTGVVIGMVLMILVFAPVLAFISRRRLPEQEEASPITAIGAENTRLPVWLALASLVFYFIGASAIWTFLERLATDNQFDPSATGLMLGITLLFAVIGSALTGVTGDRFGNFPPYIVYSIMLVAGVLLLCLTDNFIVFSIGAYAFMLAWSASDGYQYAIVADVDPDGRHIVLAVPAMGVGSMIGPILAGYLYSEGTTAWLFIMVLVTIAIAVLLARTSSSE
ncbi:MAG: MFS transporter [Gammaproteobacteria bacterium]|nr:MFS transporter [Gammaproteobacteria bacterium]